jgi:DNA-binding NtrC family response regulator
MNESSATPSSAPTCTGPRRVLVVEDESAQRLMYRKALASFGYEVECVESGAEALASLARTPVGVVVLDLHLGTEHGLDVFESIRERHPATSVVIATGHGSVEAMQRAIRLDVVDFLTKPVSLAELSAAVARAWTRHELVETPVEDLDDPVRPADDAASKPRAAPRVDAPDAPATTEAAGLVARAQDLNLEAIEQAAIREALRRSDNNRKLAAELLGLSERTLYYRLSQYRVRRRPS